MSDAVDSFRYQLDNVFSRFGKPKPPKDMVNAIQELFPMEELPQGWMVDNDEMRRMIVNIIVPTVVGRWLRKNEDYRGAQMFLGIKAQFIDINRKFWKLFHIVWEGKKPEFESERDIKMDMIGHLLMSLYLEDPSSWSALERELFNETRSHGYAAHQADVIRDTDA